MFAKAEKKAESSSPDGAVELLKAGPALSEPIPKKLSKTEPGQPAVTKLLKAEPSLPEPTPKKLSRTKPGAGVTKLQTARPAKGVVSNAKASQISRNFWV